VQSYISQHAGGPALQRNMIELDRVKNVLLTAVPGSLARRQSKTAFNKQSALTQSLFPELLSAEKDCIVDAPDSMFQLPAAELEDDAAYNQMMTTILSQLAVTSASWSTSVASLQIARADAKKDLKHMSGTCIESTDTLHAQCTDPH
jgi:hypothetical protein